MLVVAVGGVRTGGADGGGESAEAGGETATGAAASNGTRVCHGNTVTGAELLTAENKLIMFLYIKLQSFRANIDRILFKFYKM